MIELKEQIHRVKDTNNVPMILVGNKSDLKDMRVISNEEAENLAKQFNCPYIETSAKFKFNVEDIFRTLISQIKRQEPEVKTKYRKCSIV